ncbi:U3-agatoxin-Ao1j-like [Lineus longissimus]|uniref:U3-agatoxin-Ao1j-like n=1 Tax=Lineus longissimus TaxID=88925 RepID=UPI00315D2BD1
MKYLILVVALVISNISAMTTEEDFLQNIQKRGCIHRNKECGHARNNCCAGMFCQFQKGDLYLCKDNGTPKLGMGKGFHNGLEASKGK